MWGTAKRFVPADVKERIKSAIVPMVSRRTPGLLSTPGQHRMQVAAMRRSGHHAIVNWLVAAHEGSAVSWASGARPVWVTDSGRVAFVNDLTFGPRYPSHLDLVVHARRIRRAEHLVANYEDVAIERLASMPYALREPDVRIYIRRPLVDLIASRLAHRSSLGRRPEIAIPVDRTFVETVLANEQHLDGWLVIDYDRWLTNADGHRQQVLDSLGLTVDQMPGVSPFGQGSSFSGTQRVPAPEELLNRHRQIDWPADIVEMVLEPQYRSLLRPGDVEFLTGLRRC